MNILYTMTSYEISLLDLSRQYEDLMEHLCWADEVLYDRRRAEDILACIERAAHALREANAAANADLEAPPPTMH